MNRQYILTMLVLSVFLLVGCAAKKEQFPEYDKLDFAKITDLPDPNVDSFTLDNGIKCFLLEDHELPLIKVMLRVRSGQIEVPAGKKGLAEITARVMRSGGSKRYPGKKLNKILENHAAHLNISFGMSSGRASLNVLSKDINHLLPVFVNVLRQPEFPKEKIELAKKKLRTKISRRNDKQQGIAFRKFKKLVYGKNSDYARVPEYDTVDSITREDLEQFQTNALQGRKMILGIVGDFDSKKMKKTLNKAFAGFSPNIDGNKKFKENFSKVEQNKQKTWNLVNKAGVNQSFILLGHKGGFRNNPDYAKLQVMNKILSGGFSGRLFEKIRTKKGLAYAVFGKYACNYFYPGSFFVGLKTKTARTKEAIVQVQKEIKRLQEEGVTPEELRQAKSQFNNSLVFRYSSSDKIMSRMLYYKYRNMPRDSLQKLVREIGNVSAQDVQEVAREYIHPDRLQILVVGEKDKVYPQLQELGEVNILELEP